MGRDSSRETVFERIQAEVEEIAWVLARERGPDTSLVDVWKEALSLHRVRYEVDPDGQDGAGTKG